MDWHPVISVQQQTPDNDFCHISISNVCFAFWAFFSKTGKTRVSHRVKMMTRWPGRERWPKWPTDPVPCLPRRGWPRSNFAETFGIRKLESLGYRVVVVVVPFSNDNFVNCKATLILAIKIYEIKYNISLYGIHTSTTTTTTTTI